MKPYPNDALPDVCDHCGYVFNPGKPEAVETVHVEAAPPALTKEEKKKQRRKKKQARREKWQRTKTKLNPSKFRIKKPRDPTVMVKQARARFFMIIMGFVVIFGVYFSVFRHSRSVFKRFLGKKNHAASVNSKKATSGNPAEKENAFQNRTASDSENSVSDKGVKRRAPGTQSRHGNPRSPDAGENTSRENAKPRETDNSSASAGDAGNAKTGTMENNPGSSGKADRGSTSRSQSNHVGAEREKVDPVTEREIQLARKAYNDKNYRACIDRMTRLLEKDPLNSTASNLINLSEQALRSRGER